MKRNAYSLSIGLLVLSTGSLVARATPETSLAIRFKFEPPRLEHCEKQSALQWSDAPFYSGSFLALRKLFQPKRTETNTKRWYAPLERLKLKKETPQTPSREVFPEESLDVATFFKRFGSLLPKLEQALPKELATENMENPATALLQNFQSRLFLVKSLLSGRELYFIFTGPTPPDGQLNLGDHNLDQFWVLVPDALRASQSRLILLKDFNGLLSADAVAKQNAPYRRQGPNEYYRYSEHFITSHGWLLRLDTDLGIEKGWMQKVIQRRRSFHAVHASPYDMRQIVSLGQVESDLAKVFSAEQEAARQQSFYQTLTERKPPPTYSAELASLPHYQFSFFGTDFLSLLSTLSIEIFRTVQPERMHYFTQEVLDILAATENAATKPALLPALFRKLVESLRENQPFLEAQLHQIAKIKQECFGLVKEAQTIAELVHEKATSLRQMLEQIQATSPEELRETVEAIKILEAKEELFTSSALGFQQQILGLELQHEQYVLFFRALERFIHDFPSLMLNPESRILIQEIENLRKTRENL